MNKPATEFSIPEATPAEIEAIAAYFRSEHWQGAIAALTDSDETLYHAHVYIETQVHPLALEEIVKQWFARQGRPLHRRIEIFTSGQVHDAGSIHGIEPAGLPHFDLLWQWAPDRLIGPAPRKETLEIWGERYMEAFLAKFPLRTETTARDEAELADYFASPAWTRYCELNEHPDVVHIHANVETSLHPSILREHALRAMSARGWEIEEAVPVAFNMRGQMHGKVVFLARRPEKIFDIAWSFNPTVGIIPSTRYWLTTESPTHDARTMHELPLLLKRYPYRWLSLAEVEAVVDAI
ncbi:hypothetical protein [Salipiger thiooxidans]|uniref:hypothetical protein n=1 Tax=Salipiger thiooxidans TaxID=282683 RepID=UPI001CD43F79|nr:hypothetical protein [Salipiger thiooxidans]MCA0849782.1 hypothetical protein [Salipiger thiooxidans]